MSYKITELTESQKKEIPGHIKKWVDIGLSTEPANFEKAESAILRAYKLCNLKRPACILRVGSPMAASYAGNLAITMLKNKIKDKINLDGLKDDILKEAKKTYYNYHGGSFWAGSCAYISFFRDVMGWENKLLGNFTIEEDLAKSCGWVWWNELVAVVSDRPKSIKLDDKDRLHNTSGPSLEYRDGFSLYNLHGVSMEPWMILKKAEEIDPKSILSVENVEQRRELLRKVGVERFIQKCGAKVLDTKGEYSLLEITLPGFNPMKYLKMKNPSIGVYHVEGVHNDCTTVQQAINWRATKDINKEWNPSVIS